MPTVLLETVGTALATRKHTETEQCAAERCSIVDHEIDDSTRRDLTQFVGVHTEIVTVVRKKLADRCEHQGECTREHQPDRDRHQKTSSIATPRDDRASLSVVGRLAHTHCNRNRHQMSLRCATWKS